MNHSGQHVMGLNEFPDTLFPVILHLGSNIGDTSSEISLIRHHSFSYFAF
jgi:hypothetical protein